MSHATSTSLHIQPDTKPPQSGVYVYEDSEPIGYVTLDDHAIKVAATNPTDLILIAEAFTDAARNLADAIDGPLS